jgi:hypothetical protein
MTLKPEFHFLEVAYPYVARCVAALVPCCLPALLACTCALHKVNFNLHACLQKLANSHLHIAGRSAHASCESVAAKFVP